MFLGKMIKKLFLWTLENLLLPVIKHKQVLQEKVSFLTPINIILILRNDYAINIFKKVYEWKFNGKLYKILLLEHDDLCNERSLIVKRPAHHPSLFLYRSKKERSLVTQISVTMANWISPADYARPDEGRDDLWLRVREKIEYARGGFRCGLHDAFPIFTLAKGNWLTAFFPERSGKDENKNRSFCFLRRNRLVPKNLGSLFLRASLFCIKMKKNSCEDFDRVDEVLSFNIRHTFNVSFVCITRDVMTFDV